MAGQRDSKIETSYEMQKDESMNRPLHSIIHIQSNKNNHISHSIAEADLIQTKFEHSLGRVAKKCWGPAFPHSPCSLLSHNLADGWEEAFILFRVSLYSGLRHMGGVV